MTRRGRTREARRFPVLMAGFAVVSVLVGAVLLRILWPLIPSLLWAAILTMLIYPVHRRISRRTGARPTLAASLTTATVVLLLVLPAILVATRAVGEARTVWPEIRTALQGPGLRRIEAGLERTTLGPLLRRLAGPPADPARGRVEELVESAFSATKGYLLDHVADAARGAAGFLFRLGVTLVALFFFLRDGARYVGQTRALLPLPPDYVAHLEERLSRTVSAVFRGIFITALGQGLLVGSAYFVAGVPAPFLLTILTVACAFIPVGGTALVWAPVAAGLFLSGEAAPALGLAVWGAAAGLAENFVKPVLIGSEARLPVLFLLLSIVGGLASFGPLGILLGPASLALAIACLRIYREDHDIWRHIGRRAPAGR